MKSSAFQICSGHPRVILLLLAILSLCGCTTVDLAFFKPKSDDGRVVGSNCRGAAPPFGTHEMDFNGVVQNVRIGERLILIDYSVSGDRDFDLSTYTIKVISDNLEEDVSFNRLEGLDLIPIKTISEIKSTRKKCPVIGIFGCEEIDLYHVVAPFPNVDKIIGKGVSVDPPDIVLDEELIIVRPIDFEYVEESSLMPLNC